GLSRAAGAELRLFPRHRHPLAAGPQGDGDRDPRAARGGADRHRAERAGVQLDVVGPQVGSELKVSAMWALFFTLLLIFLYIAVRFHTWRLSLGAILAVMHDPILVIGFFSLTQLPFDLAVVAAILAVVGYSLNDTV